jgi:hypothetical protein
MVWSWLNEKVQRLIVEGRTRVILDIAMLSYMDSSGLGQLVSCHTVLAKTDGGLTLLRVTKRNRNCSRSLASPPCSRRPSPKTTRWRRFRNDPSDPCDDHEPSSQSRSESRYRGHGAAAVWLAIVQVPSHARQRQSVDAVMTFASVSNALPPQKGHAAGRVVGSLLNRESDMMSGLIRA